MNNTIIQKAVELFKEIANLCNKTMDAGDSEKYVKSVERLNQGVSDTYNEMRKIIANSEKFSDEEKLKRLSELAEQEAESKKKCGEAIKENRENVAKIVFEIFKGLLTCGISFTPAIIRKLKNALGDGNDIPEIETFSESLIEKDA